MTDTKTAKLPFADKPEMVGALRDWGNLLCLWRLCAKPACRRARGCRGESRRCFPLNFHLLPYGVQAWFEWVGEQQQAGVPFDGAMEELDATDLGDALRDWCAAVSKSLGGNDTLPHRWWEER